MKTKVPVAVVWFEPNKIGWTWRVKIKGVETGGVAATRHEAVRMCCAFGIEQGAVQVMVPTLVGADQADEAWIVFSDDWALFRDLKG